MRPRVIIHNAVSADGRVDRFSPDAALYYDLARHWREGATLVGSETILAARDDAITEGPGAFEPQRALAGDTRPILAVVDSRGRVRHWHALRALPYWRRAVAVCSRATPPDHMAYLRERQIDTIITGDDRVDLLAALEELNARYDTKVVRVDSGGALNGALLRLGLVDEVSVLLHPCLVGGISPGSVFRAPDLEGPAGVIPLRLAHLERLRGDTIWLRYEVAHA